MMKLSKNTLAVLKNFAGINPSIYLRKGNVIATKSLNNVIYAEAKIEDVIDADVGIYDVSEFLSILGLFNTDFEVISKPQDLQAEIKDVRSRVKYTLVDPSVIVCPSKSVDFPPHDIQFDLKEELFDKLTKAASTLGLPDLVVTNVNGKIVMKAVNVKDPSANDYAIEVADYDGANKFEFYLAVENLKMVKSDFKVSISKLGATHFESENIRYIVALEANTTHDFA